MEKNSYLPYWRLSGVYFAYFALVGAISPYWALYLESLGFSPADIGVLSAIPLLTKLLAPNIWGWLTDYFGRQLLVIRLGAFGAVAGFAGLLWATSYWPVAIFLFAYSFFWNAILAQFEVLTLSCLGDKPQQYSKIRVWGSVGFIAAVVLLGVLFDWVSISWLPSIAVFILVALFVFSMSLPSVESKREHREGGGFLRVLKERHVAVFFLVFFFLQLSHGVYYVFFSIYLESYGYSKTAIGVLWAVGVVAEIFMFMKMPKILQRFSLYHLMSISLLLTTIRWAINSSMADMPYVMFATQTLHAFSFAVTHAVAMEFLRKNFAKNAHGQGQAFYAAVSFGAGAGAGAYLSGVLWEGSPELTFIAAAFASLLAWLLTSIFLKSRL